MAKIVCAWCGRILKEDSDENVSHVICPACYDEEVSPFVEAQQQAKSGKAFKPPPSEFDWLEFLQGQMSLSLALGCAFFLVLLAAEGLHWATGGITPSLIQSIVNADLPHAHHSGRGGR